MLKYSNVGPGSHYWGDQATKLGKRLRIGTQPQTRLTSGRYVIRVIVLSPYEFTFERYESIALLTHVRRAAMSIIDGVRE